MNASFSILQKLKGQFLQTVPNKSVFHVAFAPFAFTLSNEDFYFLNGTIDTGAEARKYLRAQSEFALIANSVLQKPNIWRIDSDNLLYNAYKDILNDALTIDPDALTVDERTRIKSARTVLFTSSGKDSSQYKAYKKFAVKVTEAEHKLIEHNGLRSTITEADATALAKWNINLQTLLNEKNDLMIEWQANGFKSVIESAKTAYDDIVLSKTRFIEKWYDAKNVKLASPNLLTDEFGVEFLATTCIPNAISEAAAPIWKKVMLNKAEIAQLALSFTQEMGADVLTEFGDLQPELDAINFEYCLVEILRPWFDENIINNRLWKYSDASVVVSAGDDTMTGQVPAYPVKIILAKNIDLVFTPNTPVNEHIKTQLKAGSHLFFGPLLLKTIPTNLPDDKITEFRVQQLSNPELAVITRIAVEKADRPQVFNGGRRLEMVELLNNQPQVEMRRNVEANSFSMANVMRLREPLSVMTSMPMANISATGLSGLDVDPKLVSIKFEPEVLRPPLPRPGPPAAPTPIPTQMVTVLGKVFTGGNQPLPVAEIQIMNTATAATQSVLSLEDGTYAFRDIESASYQIKVRKTGYVTQERLANARTNSVQDFLLELQPVPTETFQVIGVICKVLPRLPNPWLDGSYV